MASVIDIIPSVPIDELLKQRDAAHAALQQIRDAIQAYRDIGERLKMDTANYKFHEPVNEHQARYIGEVEWLETSTKTVDTALWEHLFDKSGLRTFMDAASRAKWFDQIDKNQTPPLTPENITATFRSLYAARGTMFEAGVVNLYSALSWDYKTNSPVKFGKKLILRYVRDSNGFANHRTCDKLDDLVRALHVLDRKPEPDHRLGAYNAIGGHALGGVPPPWEHEYFTLKTFKNGNGHVTFKRPDLIDGMNQILHKHHPNALPPKGE